MMTEQDEDAIKILIENGADIHARTKASILSHEICFLYQKYIVVAYITFSVYLLFMSKLL